MHPDLAIARYAAGHLSAEAEARLRKHLAGCARCRALYDDQVLLLRALAGDARRATTIEDARMVQRALAGAGLEARVAPAVGARSVVRLRLPRLAFSMALASAALVLLVLAGMRLRPAPAARFASAHAVLVNGKRAVAGEALTAGATVTVQSSGLAELMVARGGRLRLFPDTRVVVGPGGEVLDVERGRVWSRVDHNGRPFTVRTNGGEARVLGTSFVVEKTGDEDTEVRVIEGTVEVEDEGHRGKVKVQAGHKTSLHPHSAPLPPARYSDHDRSDWAEGLRRVMEKIGHGIGKAVEGIKDAVQNRSR